MGKVATFREIWDFLRVRKKYWLAPIFILFAFFGLLIVLGETSGLGPFVYPFF